eukprot:Hpha_TRINITY_DN15848_c4_g21::TRINITY_DN15848_c4_g21_i1::g.189056::m.189056
MDVDEEVPAGGARVRVTGRQPSLRGHGQPVAGTPPGVPFPSALRRRRASLDGDSLMAATHVDTEHVLAVPRRGQATPPSRAQSSAGDSELGDDEDEAMVEVRATSTLRPEGRPRMRCKRKRDCALTGVCDKFGSMQLGDDAAVRGRSSDTMGGRTRSKSILKKTHSGSRVRFARHGRATKDFVMFDEANIKEVQTCLQSLSGSEPSPVVAPATPRAVVLFQQAEESGGESGGTRNAGATVATPSPTVATAAGAAAAAAVVSAGGAAMVQAQADAALDAVRAASNYWSVEHPGGPPSGGEQTQPAKRGPNWARNRNRTIRQQEIEEGKSFKHILRQVIPEEEEQQGGRGISPPARTGSTDLGQVGSRNTPQSPTSDVSGGFVGSPLQCASPSRVPPGAPAFGSFQGSFQTPGSGSFQTSGPGSFQTPVPGSFQAPAPGAVGFKFAAPSPDQSGSPSCIQPGAFQQKVTAGQHATFTGAAGFKFTAPPQHQTDFTFGSGLPPFTSFAVGKGTD